jgi:uncharacterized membrane protein (DUF485 family)
VSDTTRAHVGGRNARIGLILFAVYVLLYAGFISVAALRPDTMDIPTAFGSVNLAIMYGMGLIFAALLLAFIYMLVCRDERQSQPAPEAKQ